MKWNEMKKNGGSSKKLCTCSEEVMSNIVKYNAIFYNQVVRITVEECSNGWSTQRVSRDEAKKNIVLISTRNGNTNGWEEKKKKRIKCQKNKICAIGSW